ncbi:MAG: hypothetical protein Sv326_0581 [Candidatus Fermentimicrarchaeum limneticum]|uniref:Uncharacterized protein n=1 Tax=Fermentimicrarchaeum limneticum TaxID=2795018 RepID=A0A7D6BLF7_FERL1|nr:MAG: hypothetical protein Sv326_0581 [Candidatus Fermentimicrarchaeum limneticum]
MKECIRISIFLFFIALLFSEIVSAKTLYSNMSLHPINFRVDTPYPMQTYATFSPTIVLPYDTSTKVTPRRSNTYCLYSPSTSWPSSSCTSSVPSTIARSGMGWAVNETGTIPTGEWRIGVNTSSTTSTGVGRMLVYAWKVCAINGAEYDTLLFRVQGTRDHITAGTNLETISTTQPSFNFGGGECYLIVEYYLNVSTGTGSEPQKQTLVGNVVGSNITYPTPVNRISGVALNAPQTDPMLETGQIFIVNCSPYTDDSIYGINMSFEFNYTGNPDFVEIPLSGALLTANASGEQNVRNNTPYSRLITARGGSEYYVRCRAYNSTESIYSPAQKVTVAEVHTNKRSYRSCGAVYYKVRVYDSKNMPRDENLTIRLYDPVGNVMNQSQVQTSGGVYYGVYTPPMGSQIGEWLIRIFSCGIFSKSFGVGFGDVNEFWKMEITQPTKVRFSPSEAMPLTIRFYNQAGDGVRVFTLVVKIDNTPMPCSYVNGAYECQGITPSSEGVHSLNIFGVYIQTSRLINETSYFYVGG